MLCAYCGNDVLPDDGILLDNDIILCNTCKEKLPPKSHLTINQMIRLVTLDEYLRELDELIEHRRCAPVYPPYWLRNNG
jgi:predicted amidophosphoribosyltransferase